jgi:hypothetical protein
LSGAANLIGKIGQAMSPGVQSPPQPAPINVYTNSKYNAALVNKNNGVK